MKEHRAFGDSLSPLRFSCSQTSKSCVKLKVPPFGYIYLHPPTQNRIHTQPNI